MKTQRSDQIESCYFTKVLNYILEAKLIKYSKISTLLINVIIFHILYFIYQIQKTSSLPHFNHHTTTTQRSMAPPEECPNVRNDNACRLFPECIWIYEKVKSSSPSSPYSICSKSRSKLFSGISKLSKATMRNQPDQFMVLPESTR